MSDITKIKVDGDPESSYQLYPRNEEFAKRADVQPDWNQNNPAAPDYVKNRPFYTEKSNINITWDGNTTGLTASSKNNYYKVSDLVFTLEEFEGMTFTDNSGSEYLIGSNFIINGNNVLSYADFGPVIATIDNAGSIPGAAPDIFPEAGVYFPANGFVVSLKGTVDCIVKLDNKFLDLSDYFKKTDLSDYSTKTDLLYKMDKSNPTGTGSFSLNRKADTTIGDYSFAEGNDTTASGNYSHAEGNNTTASGHYSHAEGNNTTASGNYSHAEGNNTGTESGEASHAEGNNTTASGHYSHAEGNNTSAYGDASHAEGIGTIASSPDQHVQGRNNVTDISHKYAHIVGNGANFSTPSNAHTLDWNGVPWFQGRPQFGGTAQDQGSQTVMANGDKEIILTSSTADSTKKFKITVDDSGTLTATEVT